MEKFYEMEAAGPGLNRSDEEGELSGDFEASDDDDFSDEEGVHARLFFQQQYGVSRQVFLLKHTNIRVSVCLPVCLSVCLFVCMCMCVLP